MNRRRRVRVSKFLSLVLRHRPEVAGVELDPQGWVRVDDLLAGCATCGRPVTREELEEVVATNDKRRFAFSPDGTRIRASQGHSVPVDLGYQAVQPPERLYHGTARRRLSAIRRRGLRRGQRHHVHLSPDPETATRVGGRHGRPVVLVVEAGRMHRDGHVFYRSANNVWLTDRVPPAYLAFPSDDEA